MYFPKHQMTLSAPLLSMHSLWKAMFFSNVARSSTLFAAFAVAFAYIWLVMFALCYLVFANSSAFSLLLLLSVCSTPHNVFLCGEVCSIR